MTDFREVDIDLLADYIGGALDGTPDESVVAALVADDPAWRSAYESLTAGMATVAAELGRFEAEPMPADVAAKVEEAFAAPRLTLVDSAPGVREREVKKERKPGRRLRWATPIAVAAGAVAFVGFGLDYLAGRDHSVSDSASSTTAGGAAESKARPDSGQDAAKAPAMAESGSGRGSSSGGPRQGPQILASGMNYSAKTLAESPLQALSSQPAATAGALARLNGGAALQECLTMIAEANGAGPITTETVDFAKFDGRPAIVVRFTAANGAWAWASGPSCGTLSGHADTLAKSPVR